MALLEHTQPLQWVTTKMRHWSLPRASTPGHAVTPAPKTEQMIDRLLRHEVDCFARSVPADNSQMLSGRLLTSSLDFVS